jgi:hypothetical protein
MQAEQHPLLSSSNGNGHGPTTPQSYEKYLVHTAQDLVRQIAKHFETLQAAEAEPNAGYNSRCAWRALDDLGKIEL